MNSKLIKWGIIGVGDVTEVKSGPAFQKTDGFEISAVMRRSEEKAADYARRHHIKKYYTDADQLINDTDVDAIYIATPPDSHKEYALKVAEAGKPCCVEKPMSPTYADSKEIYEAFEKTGVPLFIAYYRRSLPRFTQIKEWLDKGEVGEVRHINWKLAQPPSNADLSEEYQWRTDKNVAPGGYFDDLASHGLDLFAFYLGNYKQVQGFGTNQQGLYDAKDAITASWMHESGITGSGFWNFGCKERIDLVEILGSAGSIRFSIFEENPIVLKNADGKQSLEIPHPENVQLHHVQNLKRALTEKGFEHPSTGNTGLHTAWVMEQIVG